ncbi:MAG: nitroreductase [Proteobacteria bacterium]|nr:nitroreductase [Pseudomonadota bacterium]
MDIYEAIALRKSVRAFTGRQVPDEVVKRLLESARLAPSASNRQEWRFVVVRDPDQRQRVAQASFNQPHVGQAPVVLVCCAETDEHIMPCGQLSYPIDVAIAVTHITLCAAAEGLGSCWIGAFYEDRIKQVLDIPPQVRVVAVLPVGYPVDPSPAEKTRVPLDGIVKYERWGSS